MCDLWQNTLDETVPDTLQASGNTNVYFANGSYSANMRIFKSGTVSESRPSRRSRWIDDGSATESIVSQESKVNHR